MKIAGTYSFNRGQEEIASRHPDLLSEVERAVNAVSEADVAADTVRTSERSRVSPSTLSTALRTALAAVGGWHPVRVTCELPSNFYVGRYEPRSPDRVMIREMDFVKRRLGLGLLFGSYPSMVYNVCAKMTIFHNLGYIDHGIEIVPVKAFADEMSSGVSYFEQFVWDLESRGVADIDIPVLILGIDA